MRATSAITAAAIDVIALDDDAPAANDIAKVETNHEEQLQ